MAKTVKFRLKRINVLQASIVVSIITFFFSSIFVLTYSVFLSAIISSIPDKEQVLPAMSFMDISFFLKPILYGIIAFISTALFTFLFNLVSKWVGGIEVKVEIIEETQGD